MRYKNIECANINKEGFCLLKGCKCVCLEGYCMCRFFHKHLRVKEGEQYYHWEVNDFYEVSNKLRELAAQISERLCVEDFYYYLIESPEYQYLIQRQNRINRAFAREIRKLKEEIESMQQYITQLEQNVSRKFLLMRR